MRLVIDKNCFSKERLRVFLVESRENQALLPRYAAMECYAGKNPHKNLVLSTAMLLQFHEQVFILKDPDSLMLMERIDIRDPMALVDGEQTCHFRQLPALIASLERGNPAALAFVRRQGHEAEAIRREALEEIPKWRALIDAVFEWPWPDTIAKVRRGDTLDPKEVSLMVEFGIDKLAHTLRAEDKRFRLTAFPIQNASYYKYRWAIALWWLAIDWVQRLGSANRPFKGEKLRNDFVDIGYIVPATYFDGLMSDDGKANWTYDLTVRTVSALVASGSHLQGATGASHD